VLLFSKRWYHINKMPGLHPSPKTQNQPWMKPIWPISACEQIWKKCGFVVRVEILEVRYPKQQVHSLSKIKEFKIKNWCKIYNASTYLGDFSWMNSKSPNTLVWKRFLQNKIVKEDVHITNLYGEVWRVFMWKYALFTLEKRQHKNSSC